MIEELKEFITKPIDEIIKGLEVEIKQVSQNRILEYEIEEYNRNYYSKTILHRASPKKLYDFYQPLQIVPHGERRRDRKARIDTLSAKKLFDNFQFVTLIGSAGSGKSTITKYLFLKAIEEKYKLPIKIELRYLNEFKGTIIEYLKHIIFDQKLGTSEKIVERLLDSGKLLIFLDGYDEIKKDSKSRITKDINDLTKRYGKNTYLITSRPYTDIELLPLFHNFHVCDLSPEEIKQFVKKQLPPSENELIKKIVNTIEKQENRSYRTFLSNPLLLSMFILTFQSYADVPQKRTTFYKQVFDTLFMVHDSMSKLAFVREKQSGLSKEQFEQVLKSFSFVSFFEEKFNFSERYARITFNKIKKSKNLNFDNTKLIYDLQVAIAILNKEGLDFKFPHRSLQEYFAALYISSLSETNKNKLYKKLLANFSANSMEYLFFKSHFFKLLIELDPTNFKKEITLPFLNNLHKKIEKNINSESPAKIYNLYNMLSHIGFIMDDDKVADKIYKCTKRDGRKKSRMVFSIGDVRDNWIKKHDIDIEELRKGLSRFLENYENIQSLLVSTIESVENSDNQILDLI